MLQLLLTGAIRRRFEFCSILLGCGLLLGGCTEDPTRPAGPAGPGPKAEALYGNATTATAASFVPRAPIRAAGDTNWINAPFYFLQTELSPAVLYHSSSNHLSLFTELAASGLGAPAYAAYGSHIGPKVLTNACKLDPQMMFENWLVVWFAGARGWSNWDSPWAVFLQHRPTALALDADGLHLDFARGAGDVVVLPLYGYYKPPQGTNDWLAARGLPGKKIFPAKWLEVLPTDMLMRVRYWAGASREFPLDCEETFSVDRSADSVTIRQRFQWRSIEDDWNTKHVKLAPLSPSLALAVKDKHFPVKFSRTPMNFDYATPFGPLMGVENADSFDATFRVLQYVNETEASDAPTNSHPTIRAALDRLQQVAQAKFQQAGRYEPDASNDFCRAIPGDQWYAKALPYLDATTRSNALAGLRKHFHDDVLVTNRFVTGEFTSGVAGQCDANLLPTLWAYAHFSGDWELVRERWPLVKKLFTPPARMRWAGFGRDAVAELGDEAAPCLAMARLAYKVGDLDTYNYAAYCFTRELVHHYVKQRGAKFFREHQPWHSLEAMDDEVYLTNLEGGTAGWQIDGPKFPASTTERQFNHRWVRFHDVDVSRFYRDYLWPDVKREFDLLQGRWEPKRKWENTPHDLPSLVQLRSLLLDESPGELARVATPDQFTGPPSGQIASCLAVIHAGSPKRLVRLIPGGLPTPFVADIEREARDPNTTLVQSIQFESRENPTTAKPIWPRPVWSEWKTPTGAPWNFGSVRGSRTGAPVAVKTIPLNWNAQAVIYTLP